MAGLLVSLLSISILYPEAFDLVSKVLDFVFVSLDANYDALSVAAVGYNTSAGSVAFAASAEVAVVAVTGGIAAFAGHSGVLNQLSDSEEKEGYQP